MNKSQSKIKMKKNRNSAVCAIAILALTLGGFSSSAAIGDSSAILANDGLDIAFEVKFMTVGASNPVHTVKSADLTKVAPLVWKGNAFAGSDFEVRLEVEPTADGDRNWRFSAKGATCKEDILEVKLSFIKKNMIAGRSALLNMDREGVALPWKSASPENGGTLMWNSMQMCRFAAFLEKEKESLYFDVPPHRHVSFLTTFLKVSETSAALEVRAMPEIGEGSGFKHGEVSFCGGYRPYKGGWYEAARIYRTRPHVIATRAKAKRRGTNPKLRDIALWMWNRGLSDNVLPPAIRFQEDAGVPAALDWYWWHSNPYDSGYPNFWPPREGVEKFRATVAEAKKAGVFVQVYVNGQGWDMDDPTFKAQGGEAEVFRRPDGTFDGIAFNRYDGHRLAYACGDMPRFKAMHHELLGNLHDSGLDGQYLDQLGCSLFNPCYATNHHHAIGASLQPGYRRQLEEYRRMFPGWPLCTEEPTEEFMDLFDNIITLIPAFERLGGGLDGAEPVPAWAAVYHGLINVFGGYNTFDHIPPFDPKWPDRDRWKNEQDWVSMFPDQFAFELARNVLWGLQPTVHNFQLRHTRGEHFRRDYRFLIDTAKFYYANRDFLYDGELLHPGTMECAIQDIDFMQRFIYTKDGEYRTSRLPRPTVSHSVWRAPDGRQAAILANWSLKPQRYRLVSPDLGVLEGELPPRSWAAVNNDQRK